MPKPSSRRAILILSSTDRERPSLCVPSRRVLSKRAMFMDVLPDPERVERMRRPARAPAGTDGDAAGPAPGRSALEGADRLHPERRVTAPQAAPALAKVEPPAVGGAGEHAPLDDGVLQIAAEV